MADRSETLKLIISGDGKLVRAEIGRTQDSITRFARTSENAFTRVGAKIKSTFSKIASNPLAIVGGAAGVLAAGKALLNYDDGLVRLGINANMTSEDVLRLRKEIDGVAFSTGQSRPEIFAGINKIIEQTGDLQFARDIMKDISMASTATGAGMEYMGALAVQLRDKLKLSKDEIGAALNMLSVQGKAGAFTLESMATNGERLFAAAGRFNMRGLNQLSKFGAFLQVARMGTGSSEQATTATENVLADILDKSKEIRKIAKFDIFKSDGKLKEFDEIIKGIITGTKGSEVSLGKIFGRESIRAVSVIAAAYRDTNGFALFDELSNASADRQSEILKDYATYSRSASFQLKQLLNVAWSFADSGLSPIIQELTKNIQNMTSDPEKMQLFVDKVKSIGENFGLMATNVIKMTNSLVKIVPVLDLIGWVVDHSERVINYSPKRFQEYQNEKRNQIKSPSKTSSISLIGNSGYIPSYLQLPQANSSPVSVQNVIKMDVTVTDTGKVITKTSDPSLRVDINSNRGSFRGAQ